MPIPPRYRRVMPQVVRRTGRRGVMPRLARLAAALALCLWPLYARPIAAPATAAGPRATSIAATRQPASAGPRAYYLALGDSVAYGKQPNMDFTRGYADQLFAYLKRLGTRRLINMACPGQRTSTFIGGDCPYASELKYAYTGSQLRAALEFIHAHDGQVGPVTIDLGINDMAYVQNFKVCKLLPAHEFAHRLAMYSSDLAYIFAQLSAALHGTGDILTFTNYPAHVNQCPTNGPVVEAFNRALAFQAARYGVRVAGVFDDFGGASVPNTDLCAYTWICLPPQDFHPTTLGYGVIATALEEAAGYSAVAETAAAAAPPPPATGPTSGTDQGSIVPISGTASYRFTAGASGPATVGECPNTAMISNSLAVYDATGQLMAQTFTTMTTTAQSGSRCNWVSMETQAGHSYTVVVSAGTSGGHFAFTSAWSINNSPVHWPLSGTTHVTRRSEFNFVILSPGSLSSTICGQQHTKFSFSFRNGRDGLLAGPTSPARCQTLSYTPPNRDNYRLKILAVSGSGSWSGTLTTY